LVSAIAACATGLMLARVTASTSAATSKRSPKSAVSAASASPDRREGSDAMETRVRTVLTDTPPSIARAVATVVPDAATSGLSPMAAASSASQSGARDSAPLTNTV
jgi:hypothetical protein